MNMQLSKKGAVNSAKIEQYIMVFVLILVLFKVVAQLFPDVGSAASDLNATGFPLAEMFMTDGVLWYLVGAAILFLIYKSFSSSKK